MSPPAASQARTQIDGSGVPLPQGGPLERLHKAGDIEVGTGDLDDLPEPLTSGSGELPSHRLERLRAAER